MVIAKAGDTVFTPAIGPAARVIVREILPGIAIGAIILAHRAPLAIADIGTPAPPRDALPRFRQPAPLGRPPDDRSASPAVSHHRSAGIPLLRQFRLWDKFLAAIVRRGSA